MAFSTKIHFLFADDFMLDGPTNLANVHCIALFAAGDTMLIIVQVYELITGVIIEVI